MRNFEYLKIDHILMPTPDSPVSITEYDIDAPTTGRPESAYMHRDRVRSNVARYDFVWTNLRPAEARLLRDALTPSQILVEIRFLGETILKTMYAGDKKWQEYYDNKGVSHTKLTVALSEC